MGIFLFVWFLDESWDHSVWYYSIAAIVLQQLKKNQKVLNIIGSNFNSFETIVIC
jgi:hypothetical protein